MHEINALARHSHEKIFNVCDVFVIIDKKMFKNTDFVSIIDQRSSLNDERLPRYPSIQFQVFSPGPGMQLLAPSFV